MEHVKQIIERTGPNRLIPSSSPDSARPLEKESPQVKDLAREGACICDGSGWAEVRREFTRPIYELKGRDLVRVETVTDWKVVMVECEPCRAYRLQLALARESGLLRSERKVTLDQVRVNGPDTAIMLDMAREFCREPWGMWTLWGSYGNAKTLILQAIAGHFLNRGQRSVYVRFKNLLDFIRAGNDPDAHDDDRARYHRLLSVKVLAIDECDKARMTEYAQEFRSAFLDDRWRYGVENGPQQRHTLLAMNDDPAELPGHIYDRLRDGRFGCWLDGVWFPGITRNRDESMRPAMERMKE